MVVQPVKRPSFQNNLQSALLSALIWHLNHYCYCCCLAISYNSIINTTYTQYIHTYIHTVYVCIYMAWGPDQSTVKSVFQSVSWSLICTQRCHSFAISSAVHTHEIYTSGHTLTYTQTHASTKAIILQQCRQQLQYIQILCSAISFKLQPETKTEPGRQLFINKLFRCQLCRTVSA